MSLNINKNFGNIEKLLRDLCNLKSNFLDVSLLDNSKNRAAVYDSVSTRLVSCEIYALPLPLIKGVDRQKQQIYQNMQRYFQGLPANHALLWGARGTGKSSLVKACFMDLVKNHHNIPFLIEIYAEDICKLPFIIKSLKDKSVPIVIFCDDISFRQEDDTYKALKSMLEGGIEFREGQFLFYATSNRRHLLQREQNASLDEFGPHTQDSREEQISLSDRFGLWIGFHPMHQEVYLEIIAGYFAHFQQPISQKLWHDAALEWALTRGNRSGRTAWQFFKDFAGANGMKIDGHWR